MKYTDIKKVDNVLKNNDSNKINIDISKLSFVKGNKINYSYSNCSNFSCIIKNKKLEDERKKNSDVFTNKSKKEKKKYNSISIVNNTIFNISNLNLNKITENKYISNKKSELSFRNAAKLINNKTNLTKSNNKSIDNLKLTKTTIETKNKFKDKFNYLDQLFIKQDNSYNKKQSCANIKNYNKLTNYNAKRKKYKSYKNLNKINTFFENNNNLNKLKEKDNNIKDLTIKDSSRLKSCNNNNNNHKIKLSENICSKSLTIESNISNYNKFDLNKNINNKVFINKQIIYNNKMSFNFGLKKRVLDKINYKSIKNNNNNYSKHKISKDNYKNNRNIKDFKIDKINNRSRDKDSIDTSKLYKFTNKIKNITTYKDNCILSNTKGQNKHFCLNLINNSSSNKNINNHSAKFNCHKNKESLKTNYNNINIIKILNMCLSEITDVELSFITYNELIVKIPNVLVSMKFISNNLGDDFKLKIEEVKNFDSNFILSNKINKKYSRPDYFKLTKNE